MTNTIRDWRLRNDVRCMFCSWPLSCHPVWYLSLISWSRCRPLCYTVYIFSMSVINFRVWCDPVSVYHHCSARVQLMAETLTHHPWLDALFRGPLSAGAPKSQHSAEWNDAPRPCSLSMSILAFTCFLETPVNSGMMGWDLSSLPMLFQFSNGPIININVTQHTPKLKKKQRLGFTYKGL